MSVPLAETGAFFELGLDNTAIFRADTRMRDVMCAALLQIEPVDKVAARLCHVTTGGDAHVVLSIISCRSLL